MIFSSYRKATLIACVTAATSWSCGPRNKIKRAPIDKGKIEEPATQGSADVQEAGSPRVPASGPLAPDLLVSIELVPNVIRIPVGFSQAVQMIAVYGNGNKQDISAQVAWSFQTNSGVALIEQVNNQWFSVRGQKRGADYLQGQFQDATVVIPVTVSNLTVEKIDIHPPGGLNLAKGLKRNLTAVATLSDRSTLVLNGDNRLVWGSLNPSVATFANPNLPSQVTGAGGGSTDVTASINGLQGTKKITVHEKQLTELRLTPQNVQLSVGATTTLALEARFADGSRSPVTPDQWSSQAPQIASVDNFASRNGQVTAHSPGTTAISAILAGQPPQQTNVTVKEITLTGITLTAEKNTLEVNDTSQLTARGQFSEGPEQDVTQTVVWTSDQPAIAAVSNTTPGLVRGLKGGEATIRARLGDKEQSLVIRVNQPEVISIVIDQKPAQASEAVTVHIDDTFQLTATGEQNQNAGSIPVTALVEWTSSDPNVLVVGNDPSQKGFITPVGFGDAQVTASFQQTITDQIQIRITGERLQSLSISSDRNLLEDGQTAELTATAQFTNGQQDIPRTVTTDTTWQVTPSSGGTVAIRSGKAIFTPGSGDGATITARYEGIDAAEEIRLNFKRIERYEIEVGDSPNGYPFEPIPLRFLGHYNTDDEPIDLSSAARWSYISNRGRIIPELGVFMPQLGFQSPPRNLTATFDRQTYRHELRYNTPLAAEDRLLNNIIVDNSNPERPVYRVFFNPDNNTYPGGLSFRWQFSYSNYDRVIEIRSRRCQPYHSSPPKLITSVAAAARTQPISRFVCQDIGTRTQCQQEQFSVHYNDLLICDDTSDRESHTSHTIYRGFDLIEVSQLASSQSRRFIGTVEFVQVR